MASLRASMAEDPPWDPKLGKAVRRRRDRLLSASRCVGRTRSIGCIAVGVLYMVLRVFGLLLIMHKLLWSVRE